MLFQTVQLSLLDVVTPRGFFVITATAITTAFNMAAAVLTGRRQTCLSVFDTVGKVGGFLKMKANV